jgi:hypothetical protein
VKLWWIVEGLVAGVLWEWESFRFLGWLWLWDGLVVVLLAVAVGAADELVVVVSMGSVAMFLSF